MFLLVALLLVVGASRTGGPKTQQDRIDAITAVLACPTCSGESVFVSRAAAAESIRAEVARQVAAGLRTDEQIVGYIEQRFGGQVLLVPRASGVDALVWALPVAALVFSIYLLFSALTKRRTNLSGDLTDQREFLTNSLHDLEQEHKYGDLADKEFESLRKDYESRVASVNAQIENLESDEQILLAISDSEPKNLPRALVTTVVVLLVATFAGWLVAKQSGQRLAGDSLAGSIEDSKSTQTMLRR